MEKSRVEQEWERNFNDLNWNETETQEEICVNYPHGDNVEKGGQKFRERTVKTQYK